MSAILGSDEFKLRLTLPSADSSVLPVIPIMLNAVWLVTQPDIYTFVEGTAVPDFATILNSTGLSGAPFFPADT